MCCNSWTFTERLLSTQFSQFRVLLGFLSTILALQVSFLTFSGMCFCVCLRLSAFVRLGAIVGIFMCAGVQDAVYIIYH